MQLLRKFSLTILFVILLIHTGCAGPNFSSGKNAYSRGDYATALKNFKPLAEQGDVKAQVNLGSMYMLGLGVTKDYSRAAMWFNIAASKGNENAAVSTRLLVVQKLMTPSEIEEAQKLAGDGRA